MEKETKKFQLIKFYSKTCQPCRQMDIVVNQFFKNIPEEDYSNLDFINVDIEDPEKRMLINEIKIMTVPTIVLKNTETGKTFRTGICNYKQLVERLNSIKN